MMRTAVSSGLLLLIAVLFLFPPSTLTAQQPVDEPIFRLLSPQESGITFSNVLVETPTFYMSVFIYAYNGSGVAMMTYLGTQTARKIAGGSNAPVIAFDGREFPEHPLYNGDPWVYLPWIGAWYRTRDWLDRRLAA